MIAPGLLTGARAVQPCAIRTTSGRLTAARRRAKRVSGAARSTSRGYRPTQTVRSFAARTTLSIHGIMRPRTSGPANMTQSARCVHPLRGQEGDSFAKTRPRRLRRCRQHRLRRCRRLGRLHHHHRRQHRLRRCRRLGRLHHHHHRSLPRLPLSTSTFSTLLPFSRRCSLLSL